MSEQHDTLAELLRDSFSTVAFTGAGISTESGIPDFRSPGGVWAKSQPVLFDEYLRNPEARKEYWRQKSETHQDFVRAQPNIAHLILSRWETSSFLRGIITQNIDGMHQIAGSRAVLELHGTARQIACLNCSYRTDADPLVRQFLETQKVPKCPDCGGLMKHATVSFGQSLQEDVLSEATRWSHQASLFLALGSSLVVHPAAGLPQVAHQQGARLVIINRDETPLDNIAEMVIHAGLGETLKKVDELMGG